jgi:hypothetical protein
MSLIRFVYQIALSIIVFSPLALAQQLPREQWGAPLVSVSRAGGKWIIAGKQHRVTLSESNLALSVQAGPAEWVMVPSAAQDMLVRSRGEEFYLRLADAQKIEIKPYDTGFKTGVKISLSEWRHNGLLNKGVELDLRLFRQMIALHERLALVEMTKHEFLDKNFRRERTTFADGTTVTVDWDMNTFEIKPELK